jgi:hypothetical protein
MRAIPTHYIGPFEGRVQSQAKTLNLNLGSLHHKMKKQLVKIGGAFRKIKPR